MTDEQKDINPDDLSLEQMEKMMYEGVTEAEPEEAEPEVIEEPEATEEPDETPEEPEGDPEEPVAAEPSVEEEPPTEEPEPEGDLELQAIRARLDEAEARARHAEQTTGRFTGELGFLRQENARLKAQLAQPPGAPQEDYGDAPAAPAQPQTARQQDSAALVSLTVKQATNEFAASHPDVVEGSNFKPEFKEALQASTFDIQSILNNPDAIEASKQMTSFLSEAHSRLDVAKKEAARIAVEQKRTDQAAKLKARKRAASVSATGKPAPAKAKPKTPDDMSVEELEAAIRAQEQ